MKTDLVPLEKRTKEDDDLNTIEETVLSEYKYGFITDIEAEEAIAND